MNSTPTEGRKLLYISIGFTVAYLVLLAAYACRTWSQIASLEPNELGDLFAGAFGPLATAWLVFGFFQQRTELKQNTAALRLQAEELAAAVRQQEQLVAASREQLAAEKARYDLHFVPRIVPTVSIVNSSGSGAWLKVTLINLGYPCVNVGSISTDPDFEFDGLPFDHLAQFEPRSFNLTWTNDSTELGRSFDFRLMYTDAHAIRQFLGVTLFLSFTDNGDLQAGISTKPHKKTPTH